MGSTMAGWLKEQQLLEAPCLPHRRRLVGWPQNFDQYTVQRRLCRDRAALERF